MGKIISLIVGSFSGGASIYVYLIGAALFFCAGWTVNGWRLGEQIANAETAQQAGLADATADTRKQDNQANDATNKTEATHAKINLELAAQNKRLRLELERLLREAASRPNSVPGKAADPSQCGGDPGLCDVVLSRQDYEFLLDFAADISTDAGTVNELYRTCREWAFKVGRPSAIVPPK